MASTTPQHKRRLSNLFGTKKVKDKDLPPVVAHHQVDPPISTANHQVQPSTSTANTQPASTANHQLHPSTSTATTTGQPDSAYASSNHPSSKRDSLSNVIPESRNNADMVPVENNGNIEGVSSERNLAYNTSTGQVVDDDTGQVVVTTTTTTTTTMSTRTGKKTTKVDVQTQPTIAEAPGDMPPMSNMTSHSPAPPALPEPSASSSPVVTPMSQPTGTPISQPVGTPQSHHPVPHRTDSDAYPVPARNPMREREPMDPVSPLRPNFSYPSRSDIREDPMPQQPFLQQPIPQHPMPQQQPAPRGTFANLKAAAQGLHVSQSQRLLQFSV
jgi:hypothetical protein